MEKLFIKYLIIITLIIGIIGTITAYITTR